MLPYSCQPSVLPSSNTRLSFYPHCPFVLDLMRLPPLPFGPDPSFCPPSSSTQEGGNQRSHPPRNFSLHTGCLLAVVRCDMAPNRVKTMGRLPPRRNLRTSKAAEEEPEHLCQVCFKSFSSAQALGGHKNAHRREREEARNTAAQGTRWVAVSPSPPLMRGCVYIMGRPQFLYAPPQQLANGGVMAVPGSATVLESSYVGEESVALPGTSPSSFPFPSSSSSRASEDACTAGGLPHGCHEADDGREGPLEDLDLTLHL
ncbi:hypothetical protein Taro_015683 [Colocasia esculenta]|uniref:C2H2-type domain-containing protein n=1 Tax=Colocasia esculenta TaxID=4460 RepID=A0A843UBZ8_COLES|nr:hypothetical protein [Colocasia esculenta]